MRPSNSIFLSVAHEKCTKPFHFIFLFCFEFLLNCVFCRLRRTRDIYLMVQCPKRTRTHTHTYQAILIILKEFYLHQQPTENMRCLRYSWKWETKNTILLLVCTIETKREHSCWTTHLCACVCVGNSKLKRRQVDTLAHGWPTKNTPTHNHLHAFRIIFEAKQRRNDQNGWQRQRRIRDTPSGRRNEISHRHMSGRSHIFRMHRRTISK